MRKDFVYLFFILFICSCLSEPEEVTFIDPEQEFVIDLNQALSDQGPHLVFEISSVDHFTCQDVWIDNTLSANNQSIELLIEKLISHADCENNASTGTSTGTVAQGSNSILLSSGTYNCAIDVNELYHNEGTLEVTENGFSLHFEELEGITIGKQIIKKIPSNHLWGSLNTDSSGLTYDEFSSGLADYVETSQEIIKGDYGIFNIDATNEISFPDNTVLSNANFIFKINDFTGLQNYIETVRQTFPSIELEITLSNGLNL